MRRMANHPLRHSTVLIWETGQSRTGKLLLLRPPWTISRFEAIVRRPLMKALVLNGIGRGFDLEDVEIATPIGREVLIDVQASGLCHTDLLFATHHFVPTPAVLGHEVAGIVSAIGSEVAQIRVGDHVVGSLAQ